MLFYAGMVGDFWQISRDFFDGFCMATAAILSAWFIYYLYEFPRMVVQARLKDQENETRKIKTKILYVGSVSALAVIVGLVFSAGRSDDQDTRVFAAGFFLVWLSAVAGIYKAYRAK